MSTSGINAINIFGRIENHADTMSENPTMNPYIYKVNKEYRWWLILLSYFVSLLGAYTTTQLYIQCRQSLNRTNTFMWILLASIAFGACSIWACHFVAIIALDLRLHITYSVPLTVFSAVIAVFGTMLGLGSNVLTRSNLCETYLPVRRNSLDLINTYKPPVAQRLDESDDDEEGQHLLLDGVIHIQNSSGRLSRTSSRPASEYSRGSIPRRMACHLWYSLSYRTFFIGGVMGLTVAAMHYCGMKAMHYDGVAVYDPWLVLLSLVISYVVSMIAIIFMPADSDSLRQITFAIVAATGVSAMHWTGIKAGKFYTNVPPPYEEEIYPPTVLPLSVAFISIITCLLSYVVLARTVTQSRDRLVEMVMTKRKLWKVMAEKEIAERNDKVKTEFISIASHELRTPLHAITGFTDLLALTSLDEEQQSFVQTIRASCHALDLITKNVLDFTKLENDNAETGARNTNLNIRNTARNMIETCTIRICDVMAVELILVIENNVPRVFSVDETYFARVLMNLVGNALKFTKEGYVLCRIWAKGDNLCIEVTDTGIGIAPDHMRIIFQPFRQADTSLTRKHQGTGLGLAICHQLVVKMGGTISLDSDLGKGSVFTVTLPGGFSNNIPPIVTTDLKVAILLRCQSTCKIIQQAISKSFQVEIVGPEILRAEPEFDRCIIDIDFIAPSMMPLIQASSCTWLIYHRDIEPQGLEGIRKLPNVILLRRPICVDDNFIQRIERGTVLSSSACSIMSSHSLPNGTQSMSPPQAPHTSVYQHKSLISIDSTSSNNDENAHTRELVPIPGPLIPTLTKSVSFNEPSALPHHISQPEDPNAFVLLVEDNLVNQQLGMKMLHKLHHPADVAENGKVALDKILADRNRYKLVLMDCQMPVLNGLEATRQIREWEESGVLKGRLRIISLTANVSVESQRECEDAGSDRFLPKPLTMKRLKDEIDSLMASS